MRTRVIAVVIAFLPMTVMAGGSFEPVIVETISITGNINYTLVVVPQRSDDSIYKDPYMGGCPRFTVHGTYYSWFYALRYFSINVTRGSHIAALAYLKQAYDQGRTVNFGWMGSGFEPIDPAKPCVVRSRALHLGTGIGETAVISYHNPT